MDEDLKNSTFSQINDSGNRSDNPAKGWYLDTLEGKPQLRYWDGVSWTGNVTDIIIEETHIYDVTNPSPVKKASRSRRKKILEGQSSLEDLL